MASASMSRLATPGSACRVDLTVARHPPQCIDGHENLTSAAAFAMVSEDPGADAAPPVGGSAHPTAIPATRHSIDLRMIDSCWIVKKRSDRQWSADIIGIRPIAASGFPLLFRDHIHFCSSLPPFRPFRASVADGSPAR